MTNPNNLTPLKLKTKIVATIGPACASLDKLVDMIRAGMNVARLNLSHGTLVDHKKQVKLLRQASEQAGISIAIMIDTRGIEIRTGLLQEEAVELFPDTSFTLYTDGRGGDASGVNITYRKLPEEVSTGTPILLDDGAIELEVTAVTDASITCRVIHGGWLGNRFIIYYCFVSLIFICIANIIHRLSYIR